MPSPRAESLERGPGAGCAIGELQPLIGHDHALLARALGDAERHVRAGEQRLGIVPVDRAEGVAGACSRGKPVGRFRDRLREPFGQSGGAGGEGEDAELVTADAAQQVVGAQDHRQRLADGLQQRIAGDVTVPLVDGAEVVDVDDDQRGGAIDSRRAR